VSSTVNTWWSVRGRDAVRRATAASARASGRFVAVRVAGGDDDVPPRLLLAVHRRVGGAVTRNLVRRRIRHAVAGMPAAEQRALRGSLVMVRAQPGSGDAPWEAFAADVVAQVNAAARRVPPRTGAGRAEVSS
jgi:ribonuclease P protein component